MNKLITKIGLGAAALATLSTVAVAPAEARDRYGHRGGDAGPAIAAGIVGLAIGAAIASSNDRRYDRGYDRGYDYDRDYYRDHGYYPSNGYYARDYQRRYSDYRQCSTRRVWDRYERRTVLVRYCR